MQLAEIFGDHSIDPMPKGILLDDLAIALRLDGRDPATGILGSDLQAQVANAYRNLRGFAEAAGATASNIAHVSFFFDGTAQPALVNPEWVEMFPDPLDRPTYKFMPANLSGGELIRLEAFVVRGARRRVIAVDGVAHTNPIPMAVRIGRYLFSSRMLPYDPATGEPADTVEEQADYIFQHAETVLDRAGMDWSDVTQGRAFFADGPGHALISKRWQERLGADSPAPLHAVQYRAGNLLVMLEIYAKGAEDRS